MSHINIMKYLNHDFSKSTYILCCMELGDETLRQVLDQVGKREKQKELSTVDYLSFVFQMAGAIQYLHSTCQVSLTKLWIGLTKNDFIPWIYYSVLIYCNPLIVITDSPSWYQVSKFLLLSTPWFSNSWKNTNWNQRRRGRRQCTKHSQKNKYQIGSSENGLVEAGWFRTESDWWDLKKKGKKKVISITSEKWILGWNWEHQL